MSGDDGGESVRSGRILKWPLGVYGELLVDDNTKSRITKLKDDFHHLWSVVR